MKGRIDMTYAIVYSSMTGNTRQLALAIQAVLPAERCLYCGGPAPEALAADILYVGFWTDKGDCDPSVADFLSQVTGQKVFLFGTAGFGGSPEYFERILTTVRGHLPQGASVTGSYMCQGKMPAAVRARYEVMEENPRRAAMLENFDKALSHPDQSDLDALVTAVRASAGI